MTQWKTLSLGAICAVSWFAALSLIVDWREGDFLLGLLLFLLLAGLIALLVAANWMPKSITVVLTARPLFRFLFHLPLLGLTIVLSMQLTTYWRLYSSTGLWLFSKAENRGLFLAAPIGALIILAVTSLILLVQIFFKWHGPTLGKTTPRVQPQRPDAASPTTPITKPIVLKAEPVVSVPIIKKSYKKSQKVISRNSFTL